MRAGGAAGGSAPQGPRCPSAQRCPWPPQPGPWGHILLRVLALQPCSQHVFPEPLVCASHDPCRRKAQTCPPTRPLPTLLPESSEKKRASSVSLQVHRSPAGLSTCVCMCVHRCANAHEHTHADRSPVRCHLVYLAGPRQSSLAGACSPASSVPPHTPPTVRSSWGLKKEASYPRGSTCKEEQERRHGRKVRHCLGLLREKKAKTLLILAKNKT